MSIAHFGTRRAIQEALGYAYAQDSSMLEFLTYLCEIDKGGCSGLVSFVRNVQYAVIRNAINEQPFPVPQWIHYCYGPDIESAQKQRQQKSLWQSLTKQIIIGPMKLLKRRRLECLCLRATEDYRLQTLSGKFLPTIEYSRAMDVYEKNFERDWGSYRKDALAILNSLDVNGIAHVSKTVKAIREAENAI